MNNFFGLFFKKAILFIPIGFFSILLTIPKSLLAIGITQTNNTKIQLSGIESFDTESNIQNITQFIAQRHELQIGSSYFFDDYAKLTIPLSMIGVSYEASNSDSNAYIYFNQLLPHNIFYELRAYGIYNYITSYQTERLPSKTISAANNPLGYGLAGIMGYNFAITSDVSLMPYLRSDFYYDNAIVYRDTDGNAINSQSYINYVGLKASFKASDILAIYSDYFFGYQFVQLSNSGEFSNSSNAQITGWLGTLEVGIPFKISTGWNITPYLQCITDMPSPNSAATNSPYKISANTVTSTLYAVKLGYNF